MRLTKSELDEILKKNKHVSVDYGEQTFNPTGKFERPPKLNKSIIMIDKPKENTLTKVSERSPWVDLLGGVDDIKENNKLSFTVPGIPIPSPRQSRRDVWMKRPCVMKYREYSDRLRSFINLNDMYVGKITMVFHLPMSASWTIKKKALMAGKPHRVKPDHDNLCKSVQDALLKNDSMVWACYTEKRWCVEGFERTELTFETTE